MPIRAARVLLALASAAMVSTARADNYPSRPVKIIVPFGAGGPTDVFVRELAVELDNALHQTFVIENRPGAGTTIGTDFVAKSAPDGYTLLMASSTQTVNETLYKNKPYQLLRDLVPIAPLEDNGLVLVVSPSVPAKNSGRASGAGAGKAGHAQFRLVRTGLELSHGRRAFEKPHRDRHRACAL